jgi:hypothetical protein
VLYCGIVLGIRCGCIYIGFWWGLEGASELRDVYAWSWMLTYNHTLFSFLCVFDLV